MQKYDISLKRFLEIGKEEIVNFILNREVEIEEEIEPSDILERGVILPIMEREADAIFRVRVKEEVFILHLEFEYEYKPEFEVRMFEYLSRIYIREKLPVYSVAIFLKKRKKPIPEEIKIEIFGEEFLRFRYKVMKLWEIDGKEILDNKKIELYPFLPLMKLKEPEQAITKASEGILEIEEEEKKEDYLAILSVMTGMYFPKLAEKLLERRDLMIKSVVYDIIKKEGIEEGKENAKIEYILSVLETRFGIVPTKVEERVKKIKGSKKLDFLLKQAVLVENLEEFQKILIKAENVE